MPILLLLLLSPALAFAWTLNDRCELTRETPEGMVAVSPTPNGIILHLPDGLVANDVRVKVGIGGKNWIVPVVGGAVELEGAAEPFLEKNWMTVHGEGDYLLGFSLAGSSAAWAKLDDCRPAAGGGGWIRLSGDITTSTDDEMIAAIRRQRPEGLVLNSAGGLLGEAQRIGRAVREAGLATKVDSDGECLSECAFILAAGTPRSVEDGARVGMSPSLVTSGLGVYEGEEGLTAETAAYFTRMKLDGGKLAVLVTSATTDDLHIFTRTELRDLGLVSTTSPVAAQTVVEERATDGEGGGWWWLVGLAGFVAVFWGVSKIWSRA